MPKFKGDAIKDITARVTIVLSPINIIHFHGNRSSVLIWFFLMHLNYRTVSV